MFIIYILRFSDRHIKTKGADGKIDTTPLITHRFSLKDIEKAYEIFENKLDGVIKIAVTPK